MIVGRKIVAPPEPGFFQKYSMFIMIGFMLLMQFVKARAQTGVGPEGEAEAPAAAGVAPAVGTASSTATRQRSGNSEVVHHKTQ
ncbi:MAG: hypothetical protein Q8P67_17165 [archaeon]|nr:hypothetical protein [archaeon]